MMDIVQKSSKYQFHPSLSHYVVFKTMGLCMTMLKYPTEMQLQRALFYDWMVWGKKRPFVLTHCLIGFLYKSEVVTDEVIIALAYCLMQVKSRWPNVTRLTSLVFLLKLCTEDMCGIP